MEYLCQKFVIRSESEEESVISDQIDEVLKAESKPGSIFLILSLYDNFNEENFQDNGNKFFESGEFILSGLKLEIAVNNVADFTLVKLEYTLQDSFNFINFENQVLIDVINQEDLSQLIQNKSDKIVQWTESLKGQQPLIPFVEFGILGENDILTAEIILQEKEIHFVSDPS